MEDLTLEHLPLLWHQMRNMRSCNSHLRAFVEGYIAEKLAVSMWHYCFLFMTDMLHMLRGLDFTGDDPDKHWACRMRGMSLWSLAPQDERRHGEYSERRQLMIDYEDTVDNHQPGNHAESAKLVVPDAHTPQCRMELYRWVDHASVMLTVFFGPSCPVVVEGLRPLAAHLQDVLDFHNYDRVNWVALTWQIHLNLQHYFEYKGAGPRVINPIKRMVLDLGVVLKYGADVLPLDYPGTHTAAAHQHGSGPHNKSGQHKGDLSKGGSRCKCQQKADRPERKTVMMTGSAMAGRFRALLDQVQKKVPCLCTTTLWRSSEEVKELLGIGFLMLLPHNKGACLQYHIFGACNLDPCHVAHELKEAPSTEVVNGIYGGCHSPQRSFVLLPGGDSSR
jgi:hypothetical protein